LASFAAAAMRWWQRGRRCGSPPQDPELAELLGILLEAAGQWDETRTTLRHAMSLAPGNDSFRAFYGLFLLRHRALEEAERVALDLPSDSDHTEVLMLRGKLALLDHRPAEAQDFALWILSRNATERAALRLLVEAKAGQSRFLGLWWRYHLFLETGPRWAVVLIAIALVVGPMLAPVLKKQALSIIVFAIIVYLGYARRTFLSRLHRELQALHGVKLNKQF
jgi:hypothetical protein